MPRSQWPDYPRAVLTARRDSVDATLEIVEGELPEDLHGHLFVMAPVGSPTSGGLKTPPNEPTSLLSGDAYVVRLDFTGETPHVKGRLLRTPDLVADELADERGAPWRFAHAGLTRVSPLLGVRNTLNTALVPFQTVGDATRLMVTWDAGRPAEIDPDTLEWITHVGAQDEWRPGGMARAPFPLIFGTAHPAWDRTTGELFLINLGRSVADLLTTTPLVPQPAGRGRTLGASMAERLLLQQRAGVAQHLNAARAALHRAGERIFDRSPRGRALLDRLMPERFTDVLRWDGRGALERWTLVDGDGLRVSIGESAHQLAVTDSWLVIMDCAFLVGPESILSQLSALPDAAERLLRRLLRRPLHGPCVLWFVPRDALTGPPGSVRAYQVTLPWGALHFAVDRQEGPNGEVTLVVPHSHEVDLSAWVLQGETNGLDGGPVPDSLIGAHPSPVDQNRVVEWTVDPRQEAAVSSRACPPSDTTWGVALAAGQEHGIDRPPARHTGDLYYYSSGLHPATVTGWAWRQYVEDDPHRLVSEEQLDRRAAAGGVPATLWRLDRESMTAADSWSAPTGAALCSPQFVPRRQGRRGVRADRDGWLVAGLFEGDDHHWLVFDAADLAAGPVCRLACPELDVGFTMHTAWLPTLATRTAPYRIDPAADLAGRVPPGAETMFARVLATFQPEGTGAVNPV